MEKSIDNEKPQTTVKAWTTTDFKTKGRINPGQDIDPFRPFIHYLTWDGLIGRKSIEIFPPILRWLTGSALGHRSLQPEFESRRVHIRRVFHLRLRFITFGDGSAH